MTTSKLTRQVGTTGADKSVDLSSLTGIDDPTHDASSLDGAVKNHRCSGNSDFKSEEGLPMLRPELILEPVQFDKNGQRKWILQDPIRSKYYCLGWLEFELLSRWQCGHITTLINQINSETTLRVDRSHFDSLLTMLVNNELVQSTTVDDMGALQSRLKKKNSSALKSLFSATMFYRKPLVNPDQFLAHLNRWLAPLYAHKRLLITLWVFTAIFALNGISTHWYEFRNSFASFMTVEGFVLFGVVLLLTNTLHEIGHGLVAKHYKCRVTEMGVALIFMLPVCYCDTSDTWRLSDKHQRLLVGAGGLLMELAIATIACLLWFVLPQGILRTLAYFLTVTSLLTTIFINLNPFMKFDGYYLLADAVGVDNLQTRSFGNFRWQLRRWLTGSDDEKPHRIPESKHALMNFYAVSTWCYRLVLYLTICWMVYQFWFKALGLLLMTGVFLSMIFSPVLKEATVYINALKKSGLNARSIFSCSILVLVLTLLLVPLPRKVSAPAVLGSGSSSKIFATQAAQVSAVYIKPGDLILAGETVIELKDPELEYEKLSLTKRIETLQHRKLTEARWLATESVDQISNQDIAVYEAALMQIQQQISALRLVAAKDSTVTSVPGWLKEGVWVNTNTVLAELASSQSLEVRAYVPAAKKELLKDASATFYSSNGGDAVELNIFSVGNSNIDVLDDQSLAVVNGGVIAVTQANDGELHPLQGWAMAVLSPVSVSLKIVNERTGYVMFQAKAKSLVSSAFDRLYGVVLRESGF